MNETFDLRFKPHLFLVGDLLLLLRPVEDVLDGQHRDDRQDLVRALDVDGHDQHLR